MRVSVMLRAASLALAVSSPALGQTTDTAPRGLPSYAPQVSLSGPRFGVTFLSAGIVDRLDREDVQVGSLVTQFGWQFEKRFYSSEDGPTAVTEWVLVVGGLEQGLVLPSVSWLVGLRTRRGTEFGVGPNLSPGGAALALAAGMTFKAGALNVPLNLAVVPSKSGVRVSVLCGFNTRRR